MKHPPLHYRINGCRANLYQPSLCWSLCCFSSWLRLCHRHLNESKMWYTKSCFPFLSVFLFKPWSGNWKVDPTVQWDPILETIMYTVVGVESPLNGCPLLGPHTMFSSPGLWPPPVVLESCSSNLQSPKHWTPFVVHGFLLGLFFLSSSLPCFL